MKQLIIPPELPLQGQAYLVARRSGKIAWVMILEGEIQGNAQGAIGWFESYNGIAI